VHILTNSQILHTFLGLIGPSISSQSVLTTYYSINYTYSNNELNYSTLKD